MVAQRTTEQALSDVFDRLLALEPGGDEEGHPAPFALTMTPEAKRLWVAYYDRHREEQADLDDDLAAAWSKLEAYTARFALIFQLVEADGTISETAMSAAIEMSDWFAHEARRVYGLFGETEEDRDVRELVAWIQRRGGQATVREVQQGHRRFATADDAEAALKGLVESRYGVWQVTPTKTKQRREFVLSTASTYTESPESREIIESVYVDNVDGANSDLEGGEVIEL